MKSRRRSRQFVYRPSASVRQAMRLAARRNLVESLLDEIKQGSSLTRLYAGLLANTLVDEEPDLRRYASLLGQDSNHQPRAISLD